MVRALRVPSVSEREREEESERGEGERQGEQFIGGNMMMAGGGDGGGAAAMDHNGIYTNPNLHSLQQQQSQMEADNPDSRKRPLETPAEEAGCTKRTNTGGKSAATRNQLVLRVSST